MTQDVKRSQKSLIAGAGIVAILVLGVGGILYQEDDHIQSSVEGDDQLVVAEIVNQDRPFSDEQHSDGILAYKSQYGALPDSLRGTLMHQSLQVDEQGNLRISSDIRRVFDFFLATIEEEELDTILARIDEYLNYYLQEPALSQSKKILVQYIDLKQALYDFELSRSGSLKEMIDSGELLADKSRYLKLLQEQLKTQSDLRAQYLDPEVNEAFYAAEEAYDEYSLSRLLVESDENLSATGKAERLAQIDAAAPSDLVESRREAGITDELKSKVEQIKSEGGGQEEIRELRAEMFGEDAAQRFDALDQERAQWKLRIDSFLDQRQDILSLEGLSMEERQAQVDTLRESQFDSREQIRVKVYERKKGA